MIVKDLIEKLKDFPPNMPIALKAGCVTTCEKELTVVEFENFNGKVYARIQPKNRRDFR